MMDGGFVNSAQDMCWLAYGIVAKWKKFPLAQNQCDGYRVVLQWWGPPGDGLRAVDLQIISMVESALNFLPAENLRK